MLNNLNLPIWKMLLVYGVEKINCKLIIEAISGEEIPKGLITSDKNISKSAMAWALSKHPNSYESNTELCELVRSFLHKNFILSDIEKTQLHPALPFFIIVLLVIHGQLPESRLAAFSKGLPNLVKKQLEDDFAKAITDGNAEVYSKLLRFVHSHREEKLLKLEFRDFLNGLLQQLATAHHTSFFEKLIDFLIQQKDPATGNIITMLTELKKQDDKHSNVSTYDEFLNKYNLMMELYTFHPMFDITESWLKPSRGNIQKSKHSNNSNIDNNLEFNPNDPLNAHRASAPKKAGKSNIISNHPNNQTDNFTKHGVTAVRVNQGNDFSLRHQSFVTCLRDEAAQKNPRADSRQKAQFSPVKSVVPSTKLSAGQKDSPVSKLRAWSSGLPAPENESVHGVVEAELLPNKYVPFFRGIHFFDNRASFDAYSFPHALESPALSNLKMHSSEEEALKKIDNLMGALEGHDKPNAQAKGYKSWRDWAHQVYSNAYISYSKLIEATPQFRDAGINKHPFVSFGQELIHPLRYAYAQKVSGPRHETVLHPEYSESGKPRNAEVGYVYVALIPKEELTQLSFVNVSQYIAQDKIDINPRVMPEREVSFFGRVDEQYIKMRFLITWPDFSSSDGDVKIKFGLSTGDYSNISIANDSEKLINLQKDEVLRQLHEYCNKNNASLCYQGLWDNTFVYELPSLNSIRIVKLFKKTEEIIKKIISLEFSDEAKNIIKGNVWLRQLLILMEKKIDRDHALNGAEELFKNFNQFYKKYDQEISSFIQQLQAEIPPVLQRYLLLHPDDFIKKISELNNKDKQSIEKILDDSLRPDSNMYTISPEILDAYESHKSTQMRNHVSISIPQSRTSVRGSAPILQQRNTIPPSVHPHDENGPDYLLRFLFLAIEQKNYEKIDYYKSYQVYRLKGSDIRLIHGKTALHLAIEKRDVEAVRILRNGKGYTVVSEFATEGNCSGMNCLQYAAAIAGVEIVRLLLTQNENVDCLTKNNCIESFRGLTAIQIACIKADIDSVKLLLRYHADPFRKTNDGKTLKELAENAPELQKYLASIDNFKQAVADYFAESKEQYSRKGREIIQDKIDNRIKLSDQQFVYLKRRLLGLYLSENLKKAADRIKSCLEEYLRIYKDELDVKVINQLLITLCPDDVGYNLLCLLCRDGQHDLLLYLITSFGAKFNEIPSRFITETADVPLVVAAIFCQYELLEKVWGVRQVDFGILNPKKNDTVAKHAEEYQKIVVSLPLEEHVTYKLPAPESLQKFIDFNSKSKTKCSPDDATPVKKGIHYMYPMGKRNSFHPSLSNQVLEGLEYQRIPGDGNCLFNAAGLYLGQDAAFLRRIVADHMEENFADFVPFYARENRSFEQHIRDIRTGNEWGSHIEIQVIQQLTNRPIIIIRPNANPTIPDDLEDYRESPIFVYYNDHNHYDGFTIREGNDARVILASIQAEIGQGRRVNYSPDSTQYDEYSEDEDEDELKHTEKRLKMTK